MKRFIAMMVLAASLTVFAQSSDHDAQERVQKAKALIAVSRRDFQPFQITASDATIVPPSLIRLRKVVFRFPGGVTISSDSAEYHVDTGQIDPRGHVHIATARGDSRGWSQFGVK